MNDWLADDGRIRLSSFHDGFEVKQRRELERGSSRLDWVGLDGERNLITCGTLGFPCSIFNRRTNDSGTRERAMLAMPSAITNERRTKQGYRSI